MPYAYRWPRFGLAYFLYFVQVPPVLTIHTFHPLVVQFATVLLFVTPIGLVIWSHVQTPSWHAAAFSTALGGALGATLAYPTGKALVPYGVNRDLMDIYFNTHQMFATITLVLAWIVVAMIVRAYFVARCVPEVPSCYRVHYSPRVGPVAVTTAPSASPAFTQPLV